MTKTKNNKTGEIVAAHKHSGHGGIVSVCSAHPAVVRAAAELAREHHLTAEQIAADTISALKG